MHTHWGLCMPIPTSMEWNGMLYLNTVISLDYKWVYMGIQGHHLHGHV